MKRPDTPFPRHWRYYIVLKYAGARRRGGAGAEVLRSLVMAAERERLYLFDTTLRDGAQTNGVDFTLTDKFAIIRMLDELGIDYIEGGYPGANPTDTQLFSEPRMLQRHLHRLRHGAAARPLDLERSRPCRAARRQGRGDLLRRQVLGLSRARRARDDARGKSRRRSATA